MGLTQRKKKLQEKESRDPPSSCHPMERQAEGQSSVSVQRAYLPLYRTSVKKQSCQWKNTQASEQQAVWPWAAYRMLQSPLLGWRHQLHGTHQWVQPFPFPRRRGNPQSQLAHSPGNLEWTAKVIVQLSCSLHSMGCCSSLGRSWQTLFFL